MTDWPDWIKRLPMADTDFPGACGYLLDAAHGQTVLWSFPNGGTVNTHRHGPQLGFVVTGSVTLTVAGQLRNLPAGTYFEIGDQTDHSAVIAAGSLVVEIFADSDRHTARRQ